MADTSSVVEIPHLSREEQTKQHLYTSLPVPPGSQTIRLLDLQLAALSQDDDLFIGSLRVVSLEENPDFTTLSYVWGDPVSPSPVITITNANSTGTTPADQPIDIEITPSCSQALRHLRRRLRNSSTLQSKLTIWIDAICINQQDDHEKTGQIPLMEKIYAQASYCYIWLGEGSRELEVGIDILKWRASFFNRLSFAVSSAPTKEQRRVELSGVRRRAWADMKTRLCSSTLRRLVVQKRIFLIKEPERRTLYTEGDELSQLVQLLQCRWVTRAWTYQELVLSQNPLFLCGDNHIFWEDIVSAMYVPEASPVLNEAFGPWRSLAEVWLGFPRARQTSRLTGPLSIEDPELGSCLSQMQGTWSFAELADAATVHAKNLWLGMHPRTGGWIHIVPPILAFVMVVAPIIFTFGGLYFGAQYITPPDTKSDEWDKILLLILFILGVGACMVLVLEVLRYTWYFLNFVVKGVRHPWSPFGSLYQTIHDKNVLFLNGVWTALRERQCWDPHDKAFSLSGILTANGVSISAVPDYKTPLKDTYVGLFRDMLAWNPMSVTLIMSGRGTSQINASSADANVKWPSWLPDWSKGEPNGWLVDRASLEQDTSAAPLPTEPLHSYRRRFYPKPRISESGDTLTLTAHYIGTVTKCYPFHRLENLAFSSSPSTSADGSTQSQSLLVPDHSHLLRPLRNLASWMWSIRSLIPAERASDRDISSSLFAVLEGLFPPREDDFYFIESPGRRGSITITRHRERWEAPYNFSDSKDKFLAFEQFWDVVKDIYMTNATTTTTVTARQPGDNNATDVDIELSAIGRSNHRDRDEDVAAKILRNLEQGQATASKALEYLKQILHKLQTEKRCLFLLSCDQDFAKHNPDRHVPYADIDTDSVTVHDTNTTSQTLESQTGGALSGTQAQTTGNEQGSSSHTCSLPEPNSPPQPPTYMMAGSGPPDIIPHLDSIYLIPGVRTPLILRPYDPPPSPCSPSESAPNPSPTQTETPSDYTADTDNGTYEPEPEPDADAGIGAGTGTGTGSDIVESETDDKGNELHVGETEAPQQQQEEDDYTRYLRLLDELEALKKRITQPEPEPEPPSFQLVGPVLVHGLMHGEGFKEKSANKVRLW